jgi:hypothetical protein
MVQYARNFLVRMQSVNTATLKLNPHEGSVKDVFGVSVPFLNDFESEDLKKIENLSADNLAILLQDGSCQVLMSLAKSSDQAQGEEQAFSEHVKLVLKSPAAQGRSQLLQTKRENEYLKFNLPFEVEDIVPGYHDFVCLLKDATVR